MTANLFLTRIIRFNRSSKVSNNGVPVYEAPPEKEQQLADSVMTQIAEIYQQHGIQPTAVQQQMLKSHDGAMASR